MKAGNAHIILKKGIHVVDSRARKQGEIMRQRTKQVGLLLVSAFVLSALMVLSNNVRSEGENPNLAGAEFLVS